MLKKIFKVTFITVNTIYALWTILLMVGFSSIMLEAGCFRRYELNRQGSYMQYSITTLWCVSWIVFGIYQIVKRIKKAKARKSN